MGWKIFGLIFSIFLIWGGLSGEMVLRGTDSSEALVVVGVLFLIGDIVSIATHKKQQPEIEEKEAEYSDISGEISELEKEADPLPLALHNEAIPPTYYILEHKVASKYHQAGENQRISAEHVEIGRDPECEVRFDEQFTTVSRRHAAIIKDEANWKLAPISQKNPTFVNGRRVHNEWYLQNNDEIQCAIDGPVLVFKENHIHL